MSKAVDRSPRSAVVIGGSMAGLLAARVLSDHFDQVTVVERDVYPEGPTFRPGIPQMRHLHILLVRGQQVLEQFYPGLAEELVAAGAQRVSWPDDVLWLVADLWSKQYTPGLDILTASRGLIDQHVRQRTRALEKVSFLQGHVVDGLIFSADRKQVTGVRVRSRAATPSTDEATASESAQLPAQPSAEATELTADLVVDASGRDSRLPDWLEQAGYPVPPVTRIDAHFGYASRLYAPPEGVDIDWKVLYCMVRPGRTRGAVIAAIENGQWMVTLVGAERDYPPTDEAGFLEFTRGIRTPLVSQALAAARPLTPIYGYRRTENQWRHYEQVARRPEGLVALGDSVLALDPVYGQGMTASALEALALERCLREQGGKLARGDVRGLAARFQKAHAKAASVAWLMATGEDLRYPSVEGGSVKPADRVAQRYTDRILKLAPADPVVGMAFMRVLHLADPLTSLFAPGVVVRALRPRRTFGLAEPPTKTSFAQAVAATAKVEESLSAD